MERIHIEIAYCFLTEVCAAVVALYKLKASNSLR